MKGYEEYNDIRRLNAELQKLTKSIMEKVDADIASQRLVADQLINDIFTRSEIIDISQEIFTQASMRISLGNPPGKNSSLGDAINWVVLLQSVPNGEDLHVISEDGDYFSSLNEDAAHPFLEDEWKRKKGSTLFVYRTLSSFMKEHFDGVAFSFDKTKDALIDDLSYSGSFEKTHQLIAKLDAYPYYSLKEVERILVAASENTQVSWIITDRDVSDFLYRVAVPRLASITDQKQKEILNSIIEDQKERTRDSS